MLLTWGHKLEQLSSPTFNLWATFRHFFFLRPSPSISPSLTFPCCTQHPGCFHDDRVDTDGEEGHIREGTWELLRGGLHLMDIDTFKKSYIIIRLKLISHSTIRYNVCLLKSSWIQNWRFFRFIGTLYSKEKNLWLCNISSKCATTF